MIMLNSVNTNIMIVIAYCNQRGKKWLTPYLSRVSYNIPYIAGFIACFFVGIRSCMWVIDESVVKSELCRKVGS